LTESTGVYQIGEVTEEHDLGLVFTSDLMFEKHINSLVKRANSILGIIKCNFDFKFGSNVPHFIYKIGETLWLCT